MAWGRTSIPATWLPTRRASAWNGTQPKRRSSAWARGADPHTLQPGDADRFWAWDWIKPVLGAFLQSADDQQVHLVYTFFEQLDFRRFQVDLREPIEMDDASKIPQLTAYGDELGQKILNDETDRALEITATRVSV